MPKGRCLCGAIRWRSTAPPAPPSHCHCSICRKASGAAFMSFASVPEADFAWLSGDDVLRGYRSSAAVVRQFCGVCGSPVPDRWEGEMSVPLGAMEDYPAVPGGRHIFVSSRARWYSFADGLTQYPGHPEGGGDAVTEEVPPRSDAPTRGSCLCGEVAFTITQPFSAIFNCHCSRCRHARAAAHASNGFVRMEALVLDDPGAPIRLYRLPGAKHFAQAFCERCGGAAPRLDKARDIAVVPLGILDCYGGPGAGAHIFTGSKAAWWEIADDLPRHIGAPD